MSTRFYILKIKLLTAVLSVLCAIVCLSRPVLAFPYELSYANRLTDGQGRPVTGPIDVRIDFYSDPSADARIDIAPVNLSGIALSDGVFQLSLTLTPAEFNKVFALTSDTVFIQVTDVTHGKTYQRQQFGAAPYALKIPIDDRTLSYNTDGQLTLGTGPTPTVGQVLSLNALGKIVWTDFSKLSATSITTTPPTTGQVLSYDGSKWVPTSIVSSSALTTKYTAGTYTRANISVDDYGIITGVSSGSAVSLETDVTGILPPQSGGTGVNSSAVFPASGTIVTEGGAAILSNKTMTDTLINGELRFPERSASGTKYVGFKSADALNETKIWTLPTGDGAVGQILSTDGAGILSWLTPVAGTVTNLTATQPLIVTNGTSTPAIAINQANAANDGYLSSQDWTAFNNKQPAGNYLANLTGDVVVASSGSGTAIAALASVVWPGTATKISYDGKGRVLSGDSLSVGDIPQLPASVINSGVLGVAVGGTGATNFANNGVVLGNSLGNLLSTAAGISYQALRVPSDGSAPAFGAIDLSQVNAVTGFLSSQNGGTGVASTAAYPASGVIVTEAGVANLTNKTLSGATINGATTLDVSGSISTRSQAGINIRPDGAAVGNTGELRFYDLPASGSDYVAFKAADDITETTTWVLPNADGTPGQFLSTNGTGALSWVSPSATTTLGGMDFDQNTRTDGYVIKWNQSQSKYQLSPDQTGASGTGIQTINSLAASNQTLAADNAGTSLMFESNAVTHTLHVPLVSTSGASYGLISSSDYNLMKAKLASVTAGPGIDVTSTGGVATVGLTPVGSAGTYTKVTTNNSGQIISGMPLAVADIPNLDASKITSGILPVSRGGTGVSTLSTNAVLLGSGTSALQTVDPGTNGNILTSNGTTWQSTAIPWSAPPVIGLTTPNSGSFTTIKTTGQAGHSLMPYGSSAGNTGELRFHPLTGSNFVGFKAPDVVSSTKPWVLPPADGSANQVLTTNGAGTLSWASAATQWATNGTSVSYSSGNVGIGTTNPSAMLHLSGSGTVANLLATTTAANSAFSRYTNGPSTAYVGMDGVGFLNTSPGASVLGSSASQPVILAPGLAEKVRITSAGNVGIGTTSPTNNLQIGSTTGTGTTSPASLSLGATYSSIAGANPKLKLWDPGTVGSAYGLGVSASQMEFIVPSGARYAWFIGGTERARFDGNGNLGIGTTSPIQKLDVSGTIRSSSGGFMFPDGTVMTTAITATTAGASSTGDLNLVADSGATGSGAIIVSANGTERMRVLNSGNIGIGTTAPTALLETSSSTTGPSFKSSSLMLQGYSVNNSWISDNLYYNSGWKYSANGLGTTMHNLYGDVVFFAAVNNTSGAGAAATLSERLRISNAGNVGIGATNPGHLLQVGSGAADGQTVAIRGYSTGTSWKGGAAFGFSTANVIMGELNGVAQIGGHNGTLGAWTNLALNSAGGKVGIGTTSPVSKLDVNGGISAGSYAGINAAPTNGMIISGNVGIGTTTPAALLDVSQSLQVNSSGMVRIGNVRKYSIPRTLPATTGDTVDIGTFIFAADSSSYGSGTLRIDVASGVNGQSASYVIPFARRGESDSLDTWYTLLPSSSTSSFSGLMSLEKNTDYGYGRLSLRLRPGTNGFNVPVYLNIEMSGWPNDSFSPSTTSATNAAPTALSKDTMITTIGGNVGIGIKSPSYTLHVVGTAGLSSGTSWTNASDIRLKDVEGDYEYGLAEVKKLHTIRFRYKKDNPLKLPYEQEHTGFIAQEVKELIPDAVITRADGYLELNVDPIHWATVNAVKELALDNDRLKAEAASLRARVDKADIAATQLKAESAQLKARADQADAETAQLRAALCTKFPDLPVCIQ